MLQGGSLLATDSTKIVREGYVVKLQVGVLRRSRLRDGEKSFANNLHRVSFRDKTGNFCQPAQLTAQAPATEATIPPEINIGLTPLVLLKTIPLNAPATMVLAASCLPLK